MKEGPGYFGILCNTGDLGFWEYGILCSLKRLFWHPPAPSRVHISYGAGIWIIATRILPSGMKPYVSTRMGTWIIEGGPEYFGILCNTGNLGFVGVWEPMFSRKHKFLHLPVPNVRGYFGTGEIPRNLQRFAASALAWEGRETGLRRRTQTFCSALRAIAEYGCFCKTSIAWS